jgi:hypothetical protein
VSIAGTIATVRVIAMKITLRIFRPLLPSLLMP